MLVCVVGVLFFFYSVLVVVVVVVIVVVLPADAVSFALYDGSLSVCSCQMCL